MLVVFLWVLIVLWELEVALCVDLETVECELLDADVGSMDALELLGPEVDAATLDETDVRLVEMEDEMDELEARVDEVDEELDEPDVGIDEVDDELVATLDETLDDEEVTDEEPLPDEELDEAVPVRVAEPDALLLESDDVVDTETLAGAELVEPEVPPPTLADEVEAVALPELLEELRKSR